LGSRLMRPGRIFFWLCLAAGLVLLSMPAPAAEVLRVLSWEGYADPDVVKAFERRYKVRVQLTTVDSDTVLWQKLNARDEPPYDVLAANTAEIARYRAAGLLRAIDPAAIPNVARQFPQFRDERQLKDIFQSGKRYAVPYTYAEMGLIYDRKVFATPPESIAVLWDPAYRGRILAYDGGAHNFSLAALKTGQANPFRIPSAQWARLAGELIALRRNALGFYTQLDDSLRQYRDGNAVLMFANYGAQQLNLLHKAGLDVGYAIPREGALAWLDCWAITSASRQYQLAEKWIDYMLEPQVSGLLPERQGLSSTVHQGIGDSKAKRLWLEPLEDVDRRESLWGRIMAGDRLSRVLAP